MSYSDMEDEIKTIKFDVIEVQMMLWACKEKHERYAETLKVMEKEKKKGIEKPTVIDGTSFNHSETLMATRVMTHQYAKLVQRLENIT